MKRNILIVTLILTGNSPALLAQDTEFFPGEDVLEKIAESSEYESEDELESVFEEIEQQIHETVDLNTVARDGLDALPFLDEGQKDRLIAYRTQMGQIFSIYELSTLEGFDSETLGLLARFVRVEPKQENNGRDYVRHQINLGSAYTFEKAEGFKAENNKAPVFEGIEPRLYLKYRGEKGKQWSWGLLAENDPGEGFFDGNNPQGFDHYSGFASLNGTKALRKLIVGDFRIKTGQGLVFGSGYGLRKSVELPNIRHTGQGIRPSLYSGENGILRGIATEVAFNRIKIAAFYSCQQSDATVSETDEDGLPTVVTSLRTSGLHRTRNEITGEDALLVQTLGIHASYSRLYFSAGMGGGYTWLNCPLIPEDKIYASFYFRGEENFNISADCTVRFNRFTLFGEGAISRSGGGALLLGSEIFPSSRTRLHFLYRNYAKNFHTLSGNPFAEWSGVKNEEGLYTGIIVHPWAGIHLSAYYDVYRSPFLRYGSLLPVTGSDFSIQGTFQPQRETTLYVRLKREESNGIGPSGEIIRNDIRQITSRARFNIDHPIGKNLKIRFRAEGSSSIKGDSMNTGWLLLINLGYNSPSGWISCNGRIAWFNAGNYDARIYTYENDVPFGFSIPSFYRNGLRFYLNIKLSLSQKLSLWIKIAQSRYFDQTSVGTGYSTIEGAHKSDVKVYLRYRF
ncbi:MAG TPA: helix-hairpin-helix domain-containing protein [Prolixibacteraceae bacterium]|nr:helix-hairpin-helix domain-containing protein [Prolixibacteraceae bacterium]